MTASGFRLPTNKQRVLVVGRTGSGKTVFSLWLLSKAPFDIQPYIMVDYKRDEMIGSIDRAREIGYNDVPKHPGLYHLSAMPDDEDEINKFLWSIWKKGKIGLYFDEGLALPRFSKALQSILTQGRSLRIPIIMCTQRPVRLPPFAISETDFYSCFRLNDRRDYETITAFTPNVPEWDTSKTLPEFHSRWYDVGQDYSSILLPAPHGNEVLDVFDRRLKPQRRVI